ncbi:amino acid adenylation domain-containing protein [Vibrio ruber]|uniref:non-ribosomal peptide synthetase n=1 Tax=Vibrio ruber TaxID=184755 RepID=UPI002892C76F|nr:non-ribosomal peptide synthetase [Vibrio ruber]WNJ95893.1 amino acid adenylation domain-containing protein [Vibrio ruber]
MNTISLEQTNANQRVSLNQSALWFLYQLAPTSTAYNVYFVSELGQPGEPPLQLDDLEKSFYQAVESHEIMRTGYFQQGEQVCARLFAATQAEFTVEHQLCADAERPDWVKRSADKPFQLEAGNVLRASLLIGEDASYITVTAHHIAGDFYGMERFMQTWAEFYTHLTTGQPAPEIREQFSHWLARQESWLASESAAKATTFWQQTIGDVPEGLNIPTDFERPEVRCFAGDEWICQADSRLSDTILATAKAYQVTPYILLLSAFQYYLHRLSGQTRFLIASPTSGRRGRRDRDVVGYCANPIPVLAEFSKSISFAELMQQNTAFLKASLPHQKLPFARLAQGLMKERSADRSGLVSHMLTYTPTHTLDFCRPIIGQMLETGQRGAAHELNLGVYKSQTGELSCHWRFNTSLFREETVAAMADDFFALLDCLTDNPECALQSLPVTAWMNASDSHNECGDFQPNPQPATALALWQQRADDEVALLHHEQVITVGELNRIVARIHNGFEQQGFSPREQGSLAVLLPRGQTPVAAMLAAWQFGMPYVPFDDKLPTARLQSMMADAQVQACVGQGVRPAWLADHIVWLNVDDMTSFSAQMAELPANPASTAYMIFTSGSTGTPKAVAVGHQALAAYVTALNQRLNLKPGSVYASLASIATDLSYTALWGGLLGGFPVRVLDEEWMLDAEGLADHLHTYPVDMLKIVPSHLQGLLASERQEILPRGALVLGGEGVTEALLQQLWQTAPNLTVFNHYGPTETTVGVLAGKLTAGQPIALGTPLAGNRIYVLDDAMSPVPTGAVGQLYVAGAQLAEGYWQDAEKTAQSFIEHPLISGETIYRTGDRVRRLPNGALQFIGRADGQVKIRGYRVELAEIERKLAQLPSVSEAAVHFEKDERRESLVAFVVAEHGHEQLTAALESELPSYMLPHFWHALDQLPRHSNGKVDRKALRELTQTFIADPSLAGQTDLETGDKLKGQTNLEGQAALAGQTDIAAPQHQFVSQLQTLFAQVLQLESTSIDPQAGFFALGGDSILALQLVATARKASLPLTPQIIFRHQSPAALSAFLAEQQVKEAVNTTAEVADNRTTSLQPSRSRRQMASLPNTIECGEVTTDLSQPDLTQITTQIDANVIEDILPLSPGQQGIFYHCLLENDPSLYTNVTGMSLEGRIEPFDFLRAWQDAAQRHDILRSRFIWEGLDQPVMVVCRGLKIATDYQDWQHLSEADQGSAFAALLTHEADNGFDIGTAPLMRVTLVHFGQAQFRLVWTRHHLVIDGWTSALIAGEAIALYRQETLAEAPTLQAYSQWLADADESQALSYWQQTLAGVEAPTTLSSSVSADGSHYAEDDGESSGLQTNYPQTNYLKTQLDSTLQTQLTQQARAHNLTINTLLQLGWALTLNRVTGRSDVIFGSTTSGRSDAVTAIQQTAGMFINTLPQRVILQADMSLQALAQQVQLSASESRHADFLSLAQIQSSLSLPPGEALFDSVLVYQNYPFPPALAELDDPKIELLSIIEHSNLPLMLQVEPGETLTLHCRYDRQRISETRIATLLTIFEQALIQLGQSLTQRIDTCLSALIAHDSELAICKGPMTATPSGPSCDLIQQIHVQASQTSDKPALIASEQTYTYAALVEAVEKRAAVLTGLVAELTGTDTFIDASVTGTDTLTRTVAVALPRDAELVINLLALYRAGISYIPLDPGHPAERLENILQQSDASCLLVAEPLALKTAVRQVTIAELQTADVPAANCIAMPTLDETIPAEAIAYSIFTSGSTGQPKGVQISRGALQHFMRVIANEIPVSAQSRLLAVTTVGFDIAALELLLPLLHGGLLVLAGDDDCKDTQSLVQQIINHDINLLQATPATWQGLTEYDGTWWQKLDVLSGGEALPKTLATTLLRQANRVFNLYGPTEATIWASCEPVSCASLDNLSTNHVVIGQPFANTEFYVLDEMQHPVRLGVEGELYIAGNCLAQGYLNRAELTAEKFVANPFRDEPGARMYRTGDRVMMDEQQRIHYLGRMDFQVKLRGFRIELGEIEALLLNHEAVKEAVVVLWDGQQDSAFIAAYVSLRHGHSESTDLTAYLAEHLPGYMVPASIQIMEHLPLNTNGKINRQALPYPAARESRHYRQPETPTEQHLAEIWQQILNVPEMSVDDNFFHLGGNSLSATRLQARIQRTFNQRLPLAEIFQNPTIKALADKLSAESSQQDDLATMAALLDEFEL